MSSGNGATDPTQSEDFKGKGKAVAEHQTADAAMDEDDESSDDEQVCLPRSLTSSLAREGNFLPGITPYGSAITLLAWKGNPANTTHPYTERRR